MVDKATTLSDEDEVKFQQDYADYAKTTGMNPNPDSPKHYYDYRGLWKEEGKLPGPGEHGDSRFKLPGHPRTYVNPKTDKGSATPKKGYEKTLKTGGYVRSADGIAKRGKTRGRVI